MYSRVAKRLYRGWRVDGAGLMDGGTTTQSRRNDFRKLLALGDINCDWFTDFVIGDGRIGGVLSKVYVKFGAATNTSPLFRVTTDFIDDSSNGFITKARFSRSVTLSTSSSHTNS